MDTDRTHSSRFQSKVGGYTGTATQMVDLQEIVQKVAGSFRRLENHAFTRMADAFNEKGKSDLFQVLIDQLEVALVLNHQDTGTKKETFVITDRNGALVDASGIVKNAKSKLTKACHSIGMYWDSLDSSPVDQYSEEFQSHAGKVLGGRRL